MTSKIFKLVFIMIVATGFASSANAALMSGDLVEDANGIDWQYVGQFDLAAGPFWNDADDRCVNVTGACEGLFATPVNGVEAAEIIFGPLTSGEYAVSTIETLVNRLAWYDLFQQATTEFGDSIMADFGDDGLYNQTGDRSAFVRDRQESRMNFVFKSIQTSVSAPSVFVIFLLAAFGIALKNRR